MKLRIQGDSLRLRLTRGEVRRLDEHGAVEERVRFAPGVALIYRVKRDSAVGALMATYERNILEVRIPEQAAREWCNTDLVTLEYSRRTEESALRIVVEKDFSCLVPRAGEDESDQFPHPGVSPPAER